MLEALRARIESGGGLRSAADIALSSIEFDEDGSLDYLDRLAAELDDEDEALPAVMTGNDVASMPDAPLVVDAAGRAAAAEAQIEELRAFCIGLAQGAAVERVALFVTDEDREGIVRAQDGEHDGSVHALFAATVSGLLQNADGSPYAARETQSMVAFLPLEPLFAEMRASRDPMAVGEAFFWTLRRSRSIQNFYRRVRKS